MALGKLGSLGPLNSGLGSLEPRLSSYESYDFDDDESLLRRIGAGFVGGLSYLAGSLGKPGRSVKAALDLFSGPDDTGRVARELAAFIPFSDTLGITDPGTEITGRELLQDFGMQREGDDSFMGGVAGFGVDLVTDPFTWGSLGAGAMTKAARAFKGAGLLDDMGRMTPKAKDIMEARSMMNKAPSNKVRTFGNKPTFDEFTAAPRTSGLSNTPSDVFGINLGTMSESVAKYLNKEPILPNIPRGGTLGAGIKDLKRAAEGAGRTLGDVADEPLWQPLGVGIPFRDPFVTFGGGAAGAAAARGLDWASHAIRWSRPGLAAASIMSAASKGFQTETGQKAAKLLHAREDAARYARRGFETDWAVKRIEGGLDSKEASDDLRFLMEQPHEADRIAIAGKMAERYNADPDMILQLATDRSVERIQQFRRAQHWGAAPARLEDWHAYYATRHRTKLVGSQGNKRPITEMMPVTAEHIRRQKPLVGMPGGTIALNRTFANPKVVEALQAGKSVDDVAALLRESYLGAVDDLNKEYGTKLFASEEHLFYTTPKGRNIDRARHWAKMLQDTEIDVVQAGFFANDVQADAALAAAHLDDAILRNQTTVEMLNESGIIKAQHKPGETMLLGELLMRHLGIKGKNLDNFLQRLHERRGTTVFDPADGNAKHWSTRTEHSGGLAPESANIDLTIPAVRAVEKMEYKVGQEIQLRGRRHRVTGVQPLGDGLYNVEAYQLTKAGNTYGNPRSFPYKPAVESEFYRSNKVTRREVDKAGNVSIVDRMVQRPVRLKDTELGKILNRGVRMDVAQDLIRQHKAFTAPDEVSKVWKQIHGATNVIKSYLTTPWPAFHSRNQFSGLVRNWEIGAYSTRQVMNMTGLLRGKAPENLVEHPLIKAELQRLGKKATPEEAADVARRLLAQYDVVGKYQGEALSMAGSNLSAQASFEPFRSQFVGGLKGSDPITAKKVGQQFTGRAPGTTRDPRKAFAVRGVGDRLESEAGWVVAGETVGHTVESITRGSGWLELTRQGMDPAAAAAKIGRAQVKYDAREFSPFERNVLSVIFPFYKFSSRQIPFLARELMTRPGSGKTGMMVRLLGEAAAEDPFLPDYIVERGGIKVGHNKVGEPSYLTSLGLMNEDPASFLGTNPLLELVSRTNPLLKLPLELATGQSFFQRGVAGGRDLRDLDPPIARTISNITGMDVNNVPVPRILENVVANSPLSRLSSTARTLADPRKTITSKALQFSTGVRFTDVTEKARAARQREITEQTMLKFPQTRQFTRTYIPDEDLQKMSDAQFAEAQQLQALLNGLAKRAKAAREAEADSNAVMKRSRK